jgi:hypothetical protein
MLLTRKKALKAITASVLGAQLANTDKDAAAFIAEFTPAWLSSKEYTLKVYMQMPAEKLDWKYTPESFSFKTQFVHCITFTAAQLCGRLAINNPYQAIKPDYWAGLTKAELETELQKFYSWVLEVLATTSSSKLAQNEAFAGGDIPLWRVFYAMENHIIHHRGQAICYLRLCGITPIGYIGW